MKTSIITFSFALLNSILLLYLTPTPEKILLSLLIALIATLLSTVLRLLAQQKQPNTKHTGREDKLIHENAALSITIKNQSDTHQMLCEIRSSLARQRRDSKISLELLADKYSSKSQSSADDTESSKNSSPGSIASFRCNECVPRLISKLDSSDSKLETEKADARRTSLGGRSF